jgi:hypothetical protein
VHIDRCIPETRQDVFKEINDWLDDFTNGSKVMSSMSYNRFWAKSINILQNILLICGSKSAIAASIAFDLTSNGDSRPKFAFKHSNASLSDPSVVWRTFASNLA